MTRGTVAHGWDARVNDRRASRPRRRVCSPPACYTSAVTSHPSGGPERWRAFGIVLGAGFMTLLDVSIVNVALPSIETSLEATPSDVQWIVAGYTLAFGLVLIPAGKLGDLLGRRWVFVGGLVAFVLTSAACGLATSAPMLAVTRLLQGLSAGVLNPQVVALIQELFRGPERGRAFGLFGATIGVSTAIGPLLGGALLALFGEGEGWRAVFLVNVPIGAVLVPLALRYLPRAAREARARLDLDVLGLLLVAGAVLCLMVPFVLAAEGTSPPWWLLAVAAALLGLFVLRQRQVERAGREPVVASALVRTPSFVFGTLIGTAYFAGFTSIFLIGTLYLQTGLGLTPLQAGLVQTPFALVGAVSAAGSGRLLGRYGRWTVVGGLAVTIVGIAGVDLTAATVEGTRAAWLMAACLGIAGLGNGVTISPNQTLALADVPVTHGGAAGGVLQTAQRIGNSVGVAGIVAVFYAMLARTEGTGPADGYGEALSVGLRVTLALFGVSLLLAVADALRRQVSGPGAPPPGAPSR